MSRLFFKKVFFSILVFQWGKSAVSSEENCQTAGGTVHCATEHNSLALVEKPEVELGQICLPHVKWAVSKDHHGVDPIQRKPETWKVQKMAWQANVHIKSEKEKGGLCHAVFCLLQNIVFEFATWRGTKSNFWAQWTYIIGNIRSVLYLLHL